MDPAKYAESKVDALLEERKKVSRGIASNWQRFRRVGSSSDDGWLILLLYCVTMIVLFVQFIIKGRF